MTEQVTFQLRRGLSTGATGWTSVNPILSPGEPGFELDTDTLKIGDGITRWNNLDILRFGDRVAIGKEAGNTGQGENSVAIGTGAGDIKQGNKSVALGMLSGFEKQKDYSVAVGFQAGNVNQGSNSIALGINAGFTGQGDQSIALGGYAGTARQLDYSVAIGYQAGNTNQGSNSIAIGRSAGFNSQANNTIILNASGLALNGITGQTGSCYAAPIRNDTLALAGVTYAQLWYNKITKEIVWN